MPQKYPLEWPTGYPRTDRPSRSQFKNPTLAASVSNILDEVGRITRDRYHRNKDNIVISANVPLRIDGYPRADYLRSQIKDKGVAVYFKLDKNDVVMCCDKYDTIESNMHAIYKSIEALRSIDRWGVSDFINRSFTGFKALPQPTKTGEDWFTVLDFVRPPASFHPHVTEHYRQLAKERHPDGGGTAELFQALSDAYDEAKKYYGV